MRIDAASCPDRTVVSTRSSGGAASRRTSAAPSRFASDSRRARSGSTSRSGRYARRAVAPVEPPIRSRNSATWNMRARPGRTMSIACTCESGKRSERRRNRPVSIRRSSPSIRHRVTSHETKPSATMTATIPSCGYESDRRRPSAIGHEDDREPDRGPAAAHDRRERMQPLPAVLRLVHKPAACASPSWASRSRSRSASARSSPGIRASLAAAAVCIFTVARPNASLERPGGDVDVLHPAVRDDGKAREHHAAPHEQVVLPFRIAPRVEAPLLEPGEQRRR